MPGNVNPYSIPNRKELGKKYPEFGRKIGMNRDGQNEELMKIIRAIIAKQKKRYKIGRVRPHGARGRSLMGMGPMGEQSLPPGEPASFGYAGGVLGGTGAPPGAPSDIYQAIASLGNPVGGLPLSTLEATDSLGNRYDTPPSAMQGLLEDQRARDYAGMYPAQSSGVWEPMNTAARPQGGGWTDPVPQPGEGTSMGGDWPTPRDIQSEALQHVINKIFERGSY